MAGQHDNGKTVSRQGASTTMSNPDTRFLRDRLQHIVIAIVAILVAAALALNYYLW